MKETSCLRFGPLLFASVSTVATVFLLAGVLKLANPQPAADAMEALFGLSNGSGFASATGVIEIAAALGMATKRSRITCLNVGLLLVTAFIGVSIYAEASGMSVPCGCFGSAGGAVLGLGSIPYQACLSLLILISLHTMKRRV